MKLSNQVLPAVALALSAWAGSAAAVVDVELGIVIDGSGSISGAEFNLQRTAYQNVLNSLIPLDGSVAIGVWQFSSTVQQEFATTVIDSAADKTAMLAAVGGMAQLGGATAVGDAITVAKDDLLGNAITSTKQVIDVSTDGFSNVGVDPNTAANAAVAQGIEQVNCLGIGGNADCSFIAGAGSFAIIASDFADFERALRLKIQREANVPEPVGLALLGLAMAGLSLRRREQSA